MCAPYFVNLNNNTFRLKCYYSLFIYVHSKREQKKSSPIIRFTVLLFWHCYFESSSHNGSKLQVGDQLLTSFEPGSIMEFGFYCTALQQRASAKLCGMVQGIELQNFRRRRHLYSAGRPSRWASANILGYIDFVYSYMCVHISDATISSWIKNLKIRKVID